MENNKEDKVSPWVVPSPIRALILIIPASAVFIGFSIFGFDAKGKIAATFVGILGYVILWRPDLRRRTWFWVILGVLAIIHGLLVFLIPWPGPIYPGILLVVPGVLDLAVYYSSIYWIEKKFFLPR